MSFPPLVHHGLGVQTTIGLTVLRAAEYDRLGRFNVRVITENEAGRLKREQQSAAAKAALAGSAPSSHGTGHGGIATPPAEAATAAVVGDVADAASGGVGGGVTTESAATVVGAPLTPDLVEANVRGKFGCRSSFPSLVVVNHTVARSHHW